MKGMNLVQIAKERCANWDDPSGRCFGWSVEKLLGFGPVHGLDHCKLKDGLPCDYFERCVMPGIPKKERGYIHYGLELSKLALLAQGNQQLKEAMGGFPSNAMGKAKAPKKSLKIKDYVKSRLDRTLTRKP